MGVKEIIAQGDHLFSQRSSLVSLWQDIADNFYVERADFTASRSMGDDFAAHLTTSYPLLARRDLGNAFSAMLRPKETQWFHIKAEREDREDNDARAWLEWATGTMRRAMYDRDSNFVRATKEGDHDFAAFGQCVISAELAPSGNALLYRNWHLRDVAWSEGVSGKVEEVHRKWKPTLRTLSGYFRGKMHPMAVERLEKDPFAKIECRHVVIPTARYQGEKKYRTPWVSLHIDAENCHVMEEAGSWTPVYVVPRWQTVSGSQYAYSPATIAAFPDARLIQAMTLTLLQAGEKAVDPPMLAVQEAIRSDVSLYAGGITWVDAEYDERLGEVLRPLTMDKSGLPFGIEVHDRTQQIIAEAFYLNKLTLPPAERDMTAFEVSQRIQEYIRQALPIFEPLETDYNGALCEITFDLLLRNGGFGAPENMPQSLRGAAVQFRFESPLNEMAERQRGQQFLEAKSMLAEAASMDPGAATIIDVRGALRDVLNGIATPAKWLRSEKDMAAIEAQQAQAEQAQQLLANMEQSAGIAKDLGSAAKSMGEAGAGGPSSRGM